MESPFAGRVAWSLCTAYVGLVTFALIVGMRSTPTFGPVSLQVQPWAIALLGVVFSAFAVVGALIASRIPANTVGWLFLSIGVSVGLALASIAYVQTTLPARPWAEWTSDWSSVMAFPMITMVLLLFPDGTLTSPRWRIVAWATVAVGLGMLAGSFGPYTESERLPNPAAIESFRGTVLDDGVAGWSLLPPTLLAAAASFVVRFRGSTGQRRQQLKWFSFAAMIMVAGFVTFLVTWGAAANIALPGTWKTTVTAFGLVTFVLTLMALPLASGIAILKYRLYDIDLIINRALVYGALTTALGAVYFLGVAVLQGLLSPITGDSSVAVAGSTLAVAGLLRPARARIQNFIDRRFYRSRYDVARTVEEFSVRLRDEVDLDAVSNHLVGVVQDTMQPARVSLWLRSL